uniref:Uncharacterized protein n=1 Tax=Anguilla anguilla TaxID=7936 RepID=A0A0E9RTF5_ANGAN
MTDPGALR